MLNKTMLIGNLGADVDTRYTKTQVAVATFRIATTERWKDNEGKPQESTAAMISRPRPALGSKVPRRIKARIRFAASATFARLSFSETSRVLRMASISDVSRR